MKITDKKIRDFFAENYGDMVEYDGIKIERSSTKYGIEIDVKVISFGQKVCWFQGIEREDFFDKYVTHTNWQLGVR